MTEKVAQAIASGIRAGGVVDVQLILAEEVAEGDLKGADAWVFGSPVHIGGATGAGAAGKMAESLKEAGAKVVAEPKGFIVVKTNGPLADGEEAKAVEFGKSIAVGLMGRSSSH